MAALSDVLVIEWAPGDNPAEPSPTWVPLTSFVDSGDIVRGRSGVFEQYGGGTMSLDLINNQQFTMSFWAQHKQIRARYIGAGDDKTLFTGYVDDVNFDARDLPMTAAMRVTATDAGGLLSTLEHKGDTETFGFGERDGFPFVCEIEQLITAALADLLIPVTFSGDTYASSAPIALPEQITGNIWQVILDALEGEHGTLQVGADGVVYLNGRFTPWLAFDPDNPFEPAFIFADTGIDASAGIYAPLRDDLEFARPGATYRNDITAKSQWLEPPINVSNVPDGYPPQMLSRTNLMFTLPHWVKADAAYWANIYSDTQTYPQTVKANLWAGGQLLPIGHGGNPLAPKVIDAVVRLGTQNVGVFVTVPNDDSYEFIVCPEAVKFEFDQSKLSATLGFTNRAVIDSNYGTAGLFTLDGDADHGLDGTAILAP